jgi:hypothetical protein
MVCIALLVLVVGLWPASAVAGEPAAAPAAALGKPARHSGTLVRIGLDLSTIFIDEVVAWTGAGTGVVRRSIRLTPRTSIELIERPHPEGPSRAGRAGWHVTAIPAAELREGDFVTVITDDPRRGIAGALQVVRPAGD